jgi:hypothetical protein
MKTAFLALTLIWQISAQTPSDPPRVIRLIRGSGSTVQPYLDAKANAGVLGLAPVSGLPETWMIELHDSFGSLEDLDKALSALPSRRSSDGPPAMSDEVLPPSRALIGMYRPDWSYRPGQAIKLLPTARYVQASLYRIRPGTEREFSELIRLRKFSMDSLNVDRPDLAYKITSGGLAGTYLFLAPLPSLRTMDESLARAPAYADGVLEASEKAEKVVTEIDLRRESLLFRIEPKMSYVSEGFASADPDFWGGKTK